MYAALAQAAERDARVALRRVEASLLADLVDPSTKLSAGAVRAWQRAMERHHRTVAVVGSIIRRRACTGDQGPFEVTSNRRPAELPTTLPSGRPHAVGGSPRPQGRMGDGRRRSSVDGRCVLCNERGVIGGR